jgi:hypothetical protein
VRNGTAQKRKKRSLYVNRRNKKAKSVLVAGISFFLLLGFLLVKTLVAPLVSAFDAKSSDAFDKNIYSLLLAERDQKNSVKTLNLLIVQKTDNKLYSINISPFTKVDLPGRLGQEELGKTLEIGQALGYGDSKTALLIESVTKMLNFHVDRYIISTEDAFNSVQKSVFDKDLGYLLPWQYNKLSRDVETNLAPREIYQFTLFTRGLRSSDLEVVNLTDFADLNQKIRDITLSGEVAKESLGLVILNGTGVSNMAKGVSDACQNMGIRVALTANAENDYQNSYLITDDATSATARYILEYFPELKVMDKRSASSTGEDAVNRGELTIILGFDIQDRL